MSSDEGKDVDAEDEAAAQGAGEPAAKAVGDSDEANEPEAKAADASEPEDGDEPAAKAADASEPEDGDEPAAKAADASEPEEDDEPESEPQPVIAPDTDPGAPPPPAPGPAWKTALQWALPLVLCGAAVGVHWWLNVPDEIIETKGDQGAASKPSKRPRARAGYEPRDKKTLDRAYDRWKQADFEGEPVHGKWARKYQALVSKTVVVARRAAFEGAPGNAQVSVTDTECRTVRCRFVLRSPFEHELSIIDSSLARMRDKAGPIWRTYETEPIEPPEGAPADHHYLRVVVSFMTDEIDPRTLEVPPDPEPDAEGAPEAEGAEPTPPAAGG